MENINWIATLVSSVAFFLIGWLWYSEALFGRGWMKLMKVKKKDMENCKEGMGKKMLTGFLSTFVLVAILAEMISITGSYGVVAAIEMAFWLWIGFIATVGLSAVVWEKKPFLLYLIQVGYYLVGMLVSAIILGLWV